MTVEFLWQSSCHEAELAPVGRIPCLKHRVHQRPHKRANPLLITCGHCIECRGTHPVQRKGHSTSSPSAEGFREWPGGLASPAVYFYLRAKELECQSSVACGVARNRVWRGNGIADGASMHSALLAVRRRPQLQVFLPRTYTDICEGADIEFVGQLVVSCSVSTNPVYCLVPNCGQTPNPTPAASKRVWPGITSAMPASMGTSGAAESSSRNLPELPQPAKRRCLCHTHAALVDSHSVPRVPLPPHAAAAAATPAAIGGAHQFSPPPPPPQQQEVLFLPSLLQYSPSVIQGLPLVEYLTGNQILTTQNLQVHTAGPGCQSSPSECQEGFTSASSTSSSMTITIPPLSSRPAAHGSHGCSQHLLSVHVEAAAVAGAVGLGSVNARGGQQFSELHVEEWSRQVAGTVAIEMQ